MSTESLGRAGCSGVGATGSLAPEPAALALLALDPDRPAELLRDALADGKAEAGAAEAPRDGGIDLGERAEQTRHALRVDACAGIGHLEPQ